MNQTKRFIAPGAWFAMDYPASWCEFEDSEGTFLFYNPDNWTGNFRISAYRGKTGYGDGAADRELKENEAARPVKLGNWLCAYSKEMFEEEGAYYTTHWWLTGRGDLLLECSMTVRKGEPVTEAEEVIASLAPRREGEKYPAEVIPVRLSEILQIDEAYAWVEKSVKETLAQDFQGLEDDVPKMQRMVECTGIAPKKREAWLALGIALCVVLCNEVDGWEWRTLVDGNREAPILQHATTGHLLDPMKLVWSKVKAGQPCDLLQAYQEMLEA